MQRDETIGTVDDAPATSIADENSAFSLGLGIALGDMNDPPATGAGDTSSAISLLMGILVKLGL